MSAKTIQRLLPAACAAALAACPTATLAQAGALRIGLSSEPTAMDPHYHQVTPNDAMTSHVFETLVGQDAAMKLIPRLATAWKSVDDTTWEFTLRQAPSSPTASPSPAGRDLHVLPRDEQRTIHRRLPARRGAKFASVEARGDDTLVIKTPALSAAAQRHEPHACCGAASSSTARSRST